MSPKDVRKALSHLLSGNCGVADATMIAVSCVPNVDRLDWLRPGRKGGIPLDAPWSPADFRRCAELVSRIPSIKSRFSDIAKRVPAFRGIFAHWDELCRLNARRDTRERHLSLRRRILELREAYQ